jgi:spoIIIJ-associated protein
MIEKEARSVEEAIQELCNELGRTRDELEIEVVEERPRGLFGVLGNKRAKVRARVKKVESNAMEDEGVEYAKLVLERILLHISDDARVEAWSENGRIYLDIKGDGSGLLIGRHGQTLDALQYLVGKIVGKRVAGRRIVIVDTEAYRERRRENLEGLAQRMGERAKVTGRVVKLKPMNARDRRIVHLALHGDKGLETRSQGEGEMKRIKIIPRRRQSDERFT